VDFGSSLKNALAHGSVDNCVSSQLVQDPSTIGHPTMVKTFS
jgi:hypothetical protein